MKSVKSLMDKIVILNFVKSEKKILVDPLTKNLSGSVVIDTSRETGLSAKRNSPTLCT